MTSKPLLALISSLMLFAPDHGAFADNAQAPSSCTINGIVSGGGLINGQSVAFNFSPTSTSSPTWYGGFASGALDLSCGLFNAQADAAYYDQGTGFVPASDSSNNVLSTALSQGHYGGAVFLRDSGFGALGVSASSIMTSASLTRKLGTFGGDDGETRFGAFGELYASENLTFGGSVHHFDGAFPYFTNGYSGFELAALAKYYPSNNLALTGRVDVLLSQLEFDNGAEPINGMALSLGAEYLVADSGLSVFANGIYSSRHQSFPTSTDTIDVSDFVANVGFSFAFGGTPTNSLVARDRSGTYDNTSTFLEKLPDFVSSSPN
ncbi:MAG: hypothetical protein ABIN69_00300 [Aestuariivirga sp.]